MLTRGALLLDQRLDVAGLLDLRAAVVAARMAGKHRATVDNAYLMRVGEHRQHAPNMSMGYRVVVEIKTNIGRLADR